MTTEEKELNLLALTQLVRATVFEKDLSNQDEKLILTHRLDNTGILEKKLLSRIAVMFESQELNPPDICFLQLLHRKAGYRPKELLGKYSCIINIQECQLVKNGKEIILLEEKSTTRIFDNEVDHPLIPGSQTRISSPDRKRPILKRKDYESLIIWAHWNNYPRDRELSRPPEKSA